MKKIIGIVMVCLFASTLAAQSSSGIHFKYSRTDRDGTASNSYWAVNPQNPNFRDLYLQEGDTYTLHVLNASGRDVSSSCEFTSSDPKIADFGGYWTKVHVVDRVRPSNEDQEKGYLPGQRVEEKIPYDKNRLQTNKSSSTPITLTATYNGMTCSVRLFVYFKTSGITVKQEGDGWRLSPDLPIVFPSRCDVSDVKNELHGVYTTPKWSFSYNKGHYALQEDQASPGATYKLRRKLGRMDITEERTDPVRASDLKPGDFVVYNPSKRRYEAKDGGLRGSNRNVGSDVTMFKFLVVGIVAAVYDDGPSYSSELKGLYTSDGKKHHALVMDVVDCDQKWVYSSDNDEMKIVSGYDKGKRIGYKLTQELIAYNERRGASHRIKPIHWIVARNGNHWLQPGTTGWYLPSSKEMKEAAIREVNTSIGVLIKAGRNDVSRVRVGSDYWTSEYSHHSDKAIAWSYDDTPGVQRVSTYERKKQAELFVRAVFAL